MEASLRSTPVRPAKLRNALPAGLVHNPALIQFLQTYSRGLIVYEPQRVRLPDLLVDMVQHIEQRPLAIVCSRLDDVGRYMRALLEAGITAIQLAAADICENREATVMVGTPAGIATAMSDVGAPEYLIGTSPRLATQERVDRIARWSRRSFYLMTTTEPLTASELIELKEHLHDAELRIPVLGTVQREVAVTWLKSKFGLRLADPKLPALKRNAIWRHAGRNRLVARVARRVVAGLPAKGRSGGGHLHGESKVPRTIVVVENGEHALALQRDHLPWPIICLRRFDRAGLLRTDTIVTIPERRHEVVGPAIVTMAALARLEGADAIIRADAGTGLLPLSPEMLACPFDGLNQLRLVDFADRGHPILRQRTRKRRRAYEAAPQLPFAPSPALMS